jgi:hypothetical protein
VTFPANSRAHGKDPTTDQLKGWLRGLGFTDDRSGWMIRGDTRIDLLGQGKVNIFVFSPPEGFWSVRTEHAPRWVLEAFLRVAGIKGADQ